jgi:phosphoglycolate phosphatase-like HAD superfamily hydrolase
VSVGAVVFDLDGVIVKTNFIKHDAMLSLFANHPEQQGAISEFILSNGGVPRRAKLAQLLENYLRTEPTDALLSEYLHRYAVELEDQLAVAPMVEGIGEFIACYPAARYVCSSAPEAEVREQVTRRSLDHHLAAIYGGITPKSDALRAIAASHLNQPVVFFGDSVGDYEASCQASVAFVGVVCERDNFQGVPVVKLRDFAHRGTVEQAMAKAVAHRVSSNVSHARSS